MLQSSTTSHGWCLGAEMVCATLRGLCSFSHPELKDDNGQMLVFRAINQLKRQLADTKNVQLCNICVENRKVRTMHGLIFSSSAHPAPFIIAGIRQRSE